MAKPVQKNAAVQPDYPSAMGSHKSMIDADQTAKIKCPECKGYGGSHEIVPRTGEIGGVPCATCSDHILPDEPKWNAHLVVCKDAKGLYITTISNLDTGLADINGRCLPVVARNEILRKYGIEENKVQENAKEDGK